MKGSKSKSKSKSKLNLVPVAIITVALIGIVILIICIGNMLRKDAPYKIESRNNSIEKYQKENQEIAVNGWIRVQGTNIDYPVIHDSTNKFIENNAKSDFAWVLENPDELLNRTVILGHNLKNVSSNPIITDRSHSRFEQLMSFIYPEFAEKNQYIQYTKDGKDYLYRIFSVSLIKDYNLRYSGYLEKDELKEYIEQAINDSYYDYKVEVDETDKIITLVTCTRFVPGTTSYRFKVEGKLVDPNDNTKIAKIVEKDNYQEVKDLMKGGEVNEKTA